MNSPRNWSLLTSAAVVAAVVISLTLTVAGYFVGQRWLQDKQENSRDLLQIVATVIGANSSAALVFDDHDAAAETLASLAGYPDIIQAALYDSARQLFASYHRTGSTKNSPIPGWQSAGFQRASGTLSLYQPVDLGRGEIATLLLVADTRPLQQWVASTATLLSSMIVVAVFVALGLLFLALRPLLILPLQQMMQATRNITDNRDYSVRLTKLRDDELGDVMEAVNDMLATIEAHAADLGAALEQAERAGQAKSIFLSTMSHELRTPLNGVLGMAELLQRTELTDKQQKYTEQIRRSGKDLLAILNDILDFSKIEVHRLELESIPFDLHEAISTVTGLFQQQAEAKQVQLTSQIDETLPRMVTGDPVRFRQILVNLVANAVKFTHQGQIRVEASQGTDEVDDLVQIQVVDTGIGIEESKQADLFGAFSQADSSTTRRYGGTGLGLAIATELSRLMGGEILVDSELGKGSTFTLKVKLPTASAQACQPLPDDLSLSPENVANQECKSVLLAEDNLMNQNLARAMLLELGHQVTCVSDGQQALDALVADQFDLVLMDGEMPGMDGYEATRQLRQSEQQRNADRQVVVALTANAMNGARESCLAAGMDDYLSKPYSLGDLREMISRWCPAAASVVDSGQPPD